jgi:lipid-A-disaccharide synthase
MLERVMIISGESSGELYGALLAKSLRSRNPGIALAGVGGERMESAGVALVSRISSAFGITEALRAARHIRATFRAVTSSLRSFSPQVVVLIDYPDFNMKVAREAKRQGAKVLYYVSPQVWAWRSGRVNVLRALVDKMAVVLPFEEEIYRTAGVACEFVGHPVMDEIRDIVTASGFTTDDVGRPALRAAMKQELGIAADRPVLTCMPGSRPHEIERLLPVCAEVIESVVRRYPRYQVMIPVAPNLDASLLRGISALEACRLVSGRSVQALLASDVALIASGTSTLQAALLGVPMVVVYRLSPLTYLIGKLMVKIPHFSLVNVLLDRSAAPSSAVRVKELIQSQVHRETIMTELTRLIEEGPYRAEVIAHLEAVRRLFIHKSASQQVAGVVEMLGSAV